MVYLTDIENMVDIEEYTPGHPYCIVYRTRYGIEREKYFESEKDMLDHVNIWIDGDEDYINYFRDDIEYTPYWAE